ncbi:MAG TPA: hypothetical protein VMV92_43905 [Streptosporangiaceae bacterium]|nr:hypothetical protein [Streptosporangiaceae bacterium]
MIWPGNETAAAFPLAAGQPEHSRTIGDPDENRGAGQKGTGQ